MPVGFLFDFVLASHIFDNLPRFTNAASLP
jgi:hypothetical protein